MHVTNLIVMSFMWAACSFSSYMVAMYVKYLPGDIYTNTIASGLSQFIAQLITGFVYFKIGIRLTLSILFGISFIGGMFIIFLGEDSKFWMPFFVVLA